MTETESSPRRIGWIAAAAAAAAAIFGFDVLSLLGYAVPMLYALPLLITWFMPGVRSARLMTGIVLVLTWVGTVFSPGELTVIVASNRVIATALLLVIGWLVIKQKRLEEQRDADQAALRESDERYALVVAGADAAIWDWNVPEKRVLFSSRWKALRGLADDEVSDYETEWSSRIHPDDTERVMAAVRAHFEGRTAVFFEEYRVRHKDGRWIWILDHGIAKRDSAGKVVRMAGSETDITARKQTEEALRESEERLRLFVEYAPVAMAMFDMDMRYLVVSGRWLTDFGLVGQDLPGRSHYEIFPEIPERWKEVHRRCLAGTVERAEEDLFIRGDGSRQWLRWAVHPWHTASDTVGGIVIFSEDITERKQAEEALAKAELYYRTIFQDAGVGVAQIDSQTGQFLKVNRKYCEIVGLTEDEMVAETFMSITHPDDLAEDIGFMDRLRRGELSSFSMEKRYIKKKDGSIVWVSLNVAPLWQTGEIPSQHIAVVQDITERKQTEENLRASDELLRAVMNSLTNHIAVLDRQGAIIAVNEAWVRFALANDLERHQDEWIGVNYFDICGEAASHDEIARDVLQGLEDVSAGVRPFFEFEYPCHSEVEPRWFLLRATPLRGTTGGLVVSHENITDQKRAEDFLQDSNSWLENRVKERAAELAAANERWNWVVRATNDGVWDWDLIHGGVYYSPRWKEIHGFQDSAPLETMEEWSVRLHPEDRPRVLNKLEAHLAGRESEFWEEYRIQRKDGVYIWVLDRGVALWGGGGRAVRMVGAETDITWRKEAEEALRRREHEFRTLADNVPAYFAYIDRDRRYRFLNKRYEEIFGRSNEEVAGSPVKDLLGPDGYAKVEPYLDKALGGEPVSFEYELKIPGDGTRYLSAQYVPDRDEEGQVRGLFALLADITALKTSEAALREREAQLRDLSAQLLRVQEEERRRIARDLHDDVTQRLAALTLELHRMGQYAVAAGCDPSVVSQVKGLGTSAERLTTDVQQMAHHLHPSILDHVGLEAAVREQVDEFAVRAGVEVEVLTRDVPHPIPLEQATCLYRVLQESLQNVHKYAQASNVLVRLLGISRGIGLYVHDDGRGFRYLELSRRGAGLGLTSMAERVRLLNGTFRVRSQPGGGTEIHAWVPLEDVKPAWPTQRGECET